MKNKNKKLQIQLPVSVITLCFVCALCGVTTWCSGVGFWYYSLLIPSVFLTVQLTSVFHEFGHYLALNKCDFEVYYFKCSILTVDKYGRKKFKLSLFGEHLGEIRFFPKRETDYCKSLKKSLWGGIWGNVIIAVILNAVLCLAIFGVFGQAVSPYLTLVFSFAPYALYALTINAVPWFHPDNDASKIVEINKDKGEREDINRFYAIQKQLFDGKTYAQISSEYFEFDKDGVGGVKTNLLVYALRRAVETENWQSVDELSQIIESREDLNDEIYCELLYKSIVRNEESNIEKYSKVLKGDLDEDKPYVLRAMLANAKRVKDERFFNVLKPTALRVCESKNFCKGDVLYNRKLIETL